MRTCEIEACDGPHYGNGLCSKHYTRQRRHGDPLAAGTSCGEAKRYYQEVVLKYDGNDCLTWPYSCSHGYGQLNDGDRHIIVSRLLCEDVNGPPPTPEHQAAHSCGKGKKGCVTKAHLSWKTPAGNAADKIEHGTATRGEKSVHAKLTEAQAREILSLRGTETQAAIAKRFGVSFQLISQIHRGKTWGWLQDNDATLSQIRSEK